MTDTVLETKPRTATESAPPARRREITGKTRVAVIGAGYIANFHLTALAETDDVELVAICDVSESRARQAAKGYDAVQVVTDVARLAELDVHVAHLTVPPDQHVSLTRELLTAGIGVFVEKPFALTSDDARDLAQLAKTRGLPLAVNHNYLFRPVIERLFQRIDAGEIGRVEHVQATLSVPLRQLDAGDYSHWMFRAPRNIVFEQAVHPLSMMQHLLGSVVRAHTAQLTSTELNPKQIFHQRWATSFVAERGTATLYMAFGQPFTRSTLQVFGTDGFIEADFFHDQLSGERKTQWLDFWNSYLAGARRGTELRRDARRNLINWMRTTVGLARRDAFYLSMRGSIQAFHKALRTRAALPNNANTAIAVTEWADAVAGDTTGDATPAPLFPAAGAARSGEVVVLGGTGFIGQRVVRRLLAKNVPVTCVVRRLHSLPSAIVEPALAGRLRIVQASLGDESGMSEALRGATRCVHLATGNGTSWEEVDAVMVRGSAQVAEQCATAGIERMVYVSSIAALYTGRDNGSDVIDDSWDTDPQPDKRPLYAKGKSAAEKVLRSTAERLGLGLVVARPGVVLGEGTPMQHSGLGLWVRDNHCVGWGAGDHSLPLVLADDVADALVAATLADGAGIDGQAINLCADPGLSGKDIVEELERATGRPIKFHQRPLWLSQTMEVGKWIVKRIGGRKVEFPAYRDLKSRALAAGFSSRTARVELGWKPVEEREAFLDAAIRIYAPRNR
ncbi:MAG: Gfo/Idh/MocA family oxidoreductase [Gammaproteobacteria bacterium]|nr:Gfo/Idh/MocA family oxidoreductase [Gammaproteobacteria bacterium]